MLGGVALTANQKYVQAILIPEFYSVMHGYVAMYPNLQITMSGLSNFQLNGQQLFPNDTEGPISYHDLRADGAYPPATVLIGPDYSTPLACVYGANPGWRYFGLGMNLTQNNHGANRIVPARGNLPADKPGGAELYPFISTPIKITDTTGTMAFSSSGDITVTLSVKDPVSGTINTVQTIKINLPGGTFPTPKIVKNSVVDPGPTFSGIPYTGLVCATIHDGSEPATSQETWWGFNSQGVISDGSNPPTGIYQAPSNISSIHFQASGRFGYIAQPPASTGGTYYGGVFLRPDCDVLRTVFPPHGDFRLVAGNTYVPDTVFQPHRYYNDTTQMFASDLSNSTHTGYDPGYDTAGKYISTITSAPDTNPRFRPCPAR